LTSGSFEVAAAAKNRWIEVEVEVDVVVSDGLLPPRRRRARAAAADIMVDGFWILCAKKQRARKGKEQRSKDPNCASP